MNEPTAPIVALVLGAFPPATEVGGPVRSADAMVRLTRDTTRLRVLTTRYELSSSATLSVSADEWTEYHGAKVWYADDRNIGGYVRGLRALRKERPTILYVNSVFDIKHSLIPLLAARLGYLTVDRIFVCPRGEFAHAALQKSPLRKSLFLKLLKLLRVHHSTIWHVTSSHEAEELRARFPQARYIVKAPETLLLDAYQPRVDLPDPARLVYIGRVVPHKGLDIAIRALSVIPGEVSLDIFGPIEAPDYYRHCQTLAASMPEGKRVTFHPPLHHEAVLQVLRGASAMASPTASENFGHTIAEALSVGCPVYAPPTTPWTPVLLSVGTLVCSRRDEDWTGALRQHIESDERQHRALRYASRQAFLAARSDRDKLSFVDHIETMEEINGDRSAESV